METPVKRSGNSTTYLSLSIILLLFILPTVSCSTPPTENPSLKETQQALHVQETMSAINIANVSTQGASIAATAALIAEQEKQNAQATIHAQETIIAGQLAPTPTIEQPQLPQAPQAMTTLPASATQASAAVAGLSSTEPIVITSWKMSRFAQLNTGCYVKDQICWKGDDKYTMQQAGIIDLVLTSRETYLVDAAWPNPYLLFWHRYSIPRNARISIRADGKWSQMASYSEEQDWKLAAIPLTLFKGKQIMIQFLAGGKPFAYDQKADWFIQDIRIVPDYKP